MFSCEVMKSQFS